MSRNISAEDKKNVNIAQADVKKLLQDPKAFNAKFEELFSKFDKNRDGKLGICETVLRDSVLKKIDQKKQNKRTINKFPYQH